MTPAQCWQWDAYLGVCQKLHKPQWWEYWNVFSDLALIGGVAVVIVLVLLILGRFT